MPGVLHAVVNNAAFQIALVFAGAPAAGWGLIRLMGRGDIRVRR